MKEPKLSMVRGKTVKVLRQLGIPENLTGHTYLMDAVVLVTAEPSMIRKMTKVLYPTVAAKHGTTPAASERAMRHAIEQAWLRCDPDVQTSFFGNSISPDKGKPSNSEFIASVSDAVRQEVMS